MATNEIQINVRATATNVSAAVQDAIDKAKAAAAQSGIDLKTSFSDVNSGTRKAIAEAQAIAKAEGITIDAKIDVDKDGKARRDADAAGKSVGQSFLSAFTGVQGVGSGASAAVIAGMTSPIGIASLGGLVSAIEAVAGVLPIAAAGFVAAGVAGGTFMIGMQGVTEAIGLYNTAMDTADSQTAQAAAQQIASANSIINASQAVKAARLAVADAERNYANTMISAREAVDNAVQSERNTEVSAGQAEENALQAVQRAEEQLTQAKNAALLAEQNLTDARLAATRALEDAPNKVIDAALAQKQAVLDLENARLALAAPVQQGPTLTLGAGGITSTPAPVVPPPNMQALNLAVQQAQQRVDETGLAYQRATEDADTMATAGVNGAKQVVSAQDQLTQAQRAQSDAVTAVQAAQEAAVAAQLTGDQQITSSKQRVTDANRALDQAVITGDEQVTKSKEAVDAALRSQAQTIAQVAESAATAVGSLTAYNAAMAELSPNAQDVVRSVVGLRDAWQHLQNDISQRLFVGVGDDIRNLAATDLPILDTGLGKVAGGMNDVITATFRWLTSKDATRDLGIIFDNVASAESKLAPALKPVLQIISDLMSVATSFLPGMASGFANSAQSAADFVRNARDTGKLKEWMQSGIDAIKELAHIAWDLIGIFGDLLGKPKSGTGLLDTLVSVLDSVKWLLDHVPYLGPLIITAVSVFALVKFGSAVRDVVGAVKAWTAGTSLLGLAMDATPIGLAIVAIGILVGLGYEIYKHWDGVAGFFTGMWRDIVGAFKWGINGVIQLLNGYVDGINTLFHGANYLSGFLGIPAIPDIPHIPHWLATGGIASGLAVVGERGPELVHLPGGSQVMPASNTQNTLAGAGGSGGRVVLEWNLPGGASGLEQAIFDVMRRGVRVRGGLASLT